MAFAQSKHEYLNNVEHNCYFDSKLLSAIKLMDQHLQFDSDSIFSTTDTLDKPKRSVKLRKKRRTIKQDRIRGVVERMATDSQRRSDFQREFKNEKMRRIQRIEKEERISSECTFNPYLMSKKVSRKKKPVPRKRITSKRDPSLFSESKSKENINMQNLSSHGSENKSFRFSDTFSPQRSSSQNKPAYSIVSPSPVRIGCEYSGLSPGMVFHSVSSYCSPSIIYLPLNKKDTPRNEIQGFSLAGKLTPTLDYQGPGIERNRKRCLKKLGDLLIPAQQTLKNLSLRIKSDPELMLLEMDNNSNFNFV